MLRGVEQNTNHLCLLCIRVQQTAHIDRGVFCPCPSPANLLALSRRGSFCEKQAIHAKGG